MVLRSQQSGWEPFKSWEVLGIHIGIVELAWLGISLALNLDCIITGDKVIGIPFSLVLDIDCTCTIARTYLSCNSS